MFRSSSALFAAWAGVEIATTDPAITHAAERAASLFRLLILGTSEVTYSDQRLVLAQMGCQHSEGQLLDTWWTDVTRS